MIAIASGKGGVGKSTTTVMLAQALAAQGQPVAVMDADIYGPSLPRMLGISGQPELTENALMLPKRAHGIACNSMGFLVEEKTAAVWRGPMVTKALYQLARGTQWAPEGKPAVKLLIDYPPGTGDVQLSLAQQTPLSGAIIVTTPQAVAVADARKSADMFRKLNVPVLGVIENMSWFEDDSGQKHRLFGEGGGKALADEIGVPLLAQVPQIPAVMQAMEEGALPPSESLAVYHEALKVL